MTLQVVYVNSADRSAAEYVDLQGLRHESPAVTYLEGGTDLLGGLRGKVSPWRSMSPAAAA